MREQAEPLTIAYIAIGVENAIRAAKDAEMDVLTDEHGGQIGIVEKVIQHAKMLDDLADVAQDQMNGCFAYEVAEEFGLEYTRQLLAGVKLPSAYTIAFQLMGEITK